MRLLSFRGSVEVWDFQHSHSLVVFSWTLSLDM
jgi:hypothetical protein